MVLLNPSTGVSSNALTQQFHQLNLIASTSESPKYFPFRPSGKYESLRAKLSPVPRYLFRVSSPLSDATTNETWVRSKDAKLGRETATRDVFEEPDRPAIAELLDMHLRWRGQPHVHDNLVSWTSSLLFALQYVFYRHIHARDSSSLAQIQTCVLDTASFPRGVFIQDMDLIRSFKEFDQSLSHNSGLRNLYSMRMRRDHSSQGSFYFGEHLSQGALCIEGCCQILSAQSLINSDIFILRPGLENSMTARRAEWANRVIELRRSFYPLESSVARTTSQAEVVAARGMVGLVRPGLRLPFIVNVVALTRRDPHDETVLQFFRSTVFPDDERKQCSSSITEIVTDPSHIQRSCWGESGFSLISKTARRLTCGWYKSAHGMESEECCGRE